MKRIIYILIGFLLIGCSADLLIDEDDFDFGDFKSAVSITDSRFDGKFIYSNNWTSSDGIDEINDYLSLEFDGTNKFIYYHSYRNYDRNSGWSISGDGGADYYRFVMELEVNVVTSEYRERLWFQENESDWSDWASYSFSNDGNTLTISNLLGNDYILNKNN